MEIHRAVEQGLQLETRCRQMLGFRLDTRGKRMAVSGLAVRPCWLLILP